MSTPALKKMFEIISDNAEKRKKEEAVIAELQKDRFDKKMMEMNHAEWSKVQKYHEVKRLLVQFFSAYAEKNVIDFAYSKINLY